MHISALVSHLIDDLEDDIISLAETINQQEYQFLLLVREFDLRQGPYVSGYLSRPLIYPILNLGRKERLIYDQIFN